MPRPTRAKDQAPNEIVEAHIAYVKGKYKEGFQVVNEELWMKLMEASKDEVGGSTGETLLGVAIESVLEVEPVMSRRTTTLFVFWSLQD